MARARRKVQTAEEIRTTVRIRINRSFNGMYKGGESDVPLDGVVQGWVRAGLVVIVGGGNAQTQAGPGGPAADDAGSESARTDDDGSQGRQQGEDPRAR